MEYKSTGPEVGDLVEMTIRCPGCETPVRAVWRSILQQNGRYAMQMTRSIQIASKSVFFDKCPKTGVVCPGNIYKKGETLPYVKLYNPPRKACICREKSHRIGP